MLKSYRFFAPLSFTLGIKERTMKTISISTIFVVFFVMFFVTLSMAEDNHETLEAHAVLTVLSDDVELNAKLIEKGFTSLAKIAKCSRKDFVEKAKAAGIKEEIAISIHEKAKKMILKNKQKKIAPYHSEKNGGPKKYRENKEKE